MGTISNSLASQSLFSPVTTESNTTTTTGTGVSLFTGQSSYAQDLQNEVAREVQMAELPIEILQNQQTALTNQSTELGTLNTKFAALQTAIQGIADALSGSSFQSTIDNPSVVSATLGDGATQGNYAIQVTDIGAYATSLSASSWDGSGATPNQYTLVIGDQQYQFTPADNGAQSVAAAINARYGNLVNATVVNVGTASAPDQRISLQSTALGDLSPDLLLNGASLQSQQVQGKPASYSVDGAAPVTSSSRTVAVSPGVTLSLLGTGSANVTVTQSISAISNAISSFVTAYNDVATEVTAQRGKSGGPLQGQPIVGQLSQALSGIATYDSTTGQINTLASLGLDLGTNGQITFNSFTLAGTAILNPTGISAFLGSASGSGFLGAATKALNNVEDPISGLLPNAQSETQSAITNLDNQITAKEAQVTQLQTTLTNQMAQADAMISEIQQQYLYLTEMYQVQQANAQMGY